MGKLAQRTGVAVEAMSALSYAAKLNDVSQEELSKGLRKLSIDIDAGGAKLKALGISSTTADGALLQLADRFKQMPDGVRKTALAAEIFGEKIGPQFITLLNQGAAGIRQLMEEAKRFGVVVDTEAAARAEQFNDNLERLKTAAQGASIQIAGPLIQSLANSSSYFLKVAQDAGVARAALITFGAALARTLGVDDVGQLQTQARANQNALQLTVRQLEVWQARANSGVGGAQARVDQLRAQYDRLQAEGARISEALKGEAQAIENEYKPKPGKTPTDTTATGGAGKPPARDFMAARRDWLAAYEREASIVAAEFDLAARRLQAVEKAAAQAGERLASIWNQDTDEQASGYSEYIARIRGVEEELDRLIDNGASRKRSLTASLEARLNAGEVFSPQELERIVRGIAGISEATQEAEKAAINFADVFESRFEAAIVKGEKLSTVIKGLAQDMLQLTLREAVTKPLAAAAGGFLRTAIGFADGGVMTASGPLPLKAYSKGGIASSPQVALFGEGSMPEAYVPLPDGRRIPVAMKGGSRPITVVNNMTIGDVASLQQVQAQLRESERRTASAIGRSMRYGGALQ
jgi:hypothetical protein